MLEESLREPKNEEEITTKGENMFIIFKESEMSLIFQVNDVFIGDEEDTNESEIKEVEDI